MSATEKNKTTQGWSCLDVVLPVFDGVILVVPAGVLVEDDWSDGVIPPEAIGDDVVDGFAECFSVHPVIHVIICAENACYRTTVASSIIVFIIDSQ